MNPQPLFLQRYPASRAATDDIAQTGSNRYSMIWHPVNEMRGNTMPTDIQELKHWICDNINAIRGLDDIARNFNVAPETLRKEFVRKEGVCFSDYLAHMKIRKVVEMLTTTDLRCNEIVYKLKLGREDVVARSFKRMTGLTMVQYRKSQEKKHVEISPGDLASDAENAK